MFFGQETKHQNVNLLAYLYGSNFREGQRLSQNEKGIHDAVQKNTGQHDMLSNIIPVVST